MNAKINDERDTLSHESFPRIQWKIGIHTVGAVVAVAVANVVRVRVRVDPHHLGGNPY